MRIFQNASFEAVLLFAAVGLRGGIYARSPSGLTPLMAASRQLAVVDMERGKRLVAVIAALLAVGENPGDQYPTTKTTAAAAATQSLMLAAAKGTPTIWP